LELELFGWKNQNDEEKIREKKKSLGKGISSYSNWIVPVCCVDWEDTPALPWRGK